MGDDDETETDRRCQIIQGVESATVLKIQKVMHPHNVLMQEFKRALENMPNDICKVVIHADRVPSGQHARRYNASASSEVAAVGADTDFTVPRDIVLRKHDDSLTRIADTKRFMILYNILLCSKKGKRDITSVSFKQIQ